MNIVVTGAAGKIGRYTVHALLDAGHNVLATDKILAENSAALKFVQADLLDYGQVCQLLMGADAVIHHGNIPTDVRNTSQAIFANNMMVNFNVLEACKDFNIKKLIWASSETVMGFPFIEPDLHYVPIDEEHPQQAKSSYAMAKILTEHLSELFHQQAPSREIIGLRFANMYEPDEYWKIPVKHWNETEKDIQRMNLWAYCDVRDAAQASVLAAESENLGCQVFHVTAPDTIMPDPSGELVRRFFPNVKFKRPVEGYETLMSIDKARELLGYNPQHTWRNALNPDGSVKPTTDERFAGTVN